MSIRIRVKIMPGGVLREVETRNGCISEVLEKLGYSRESVVFLYRGEPITEDTCLEDGAVVELYVARSGG